MKQVFELRPNRDLLDPDFNGYKLSLESIPMYEKKLDADVAQVQSDNPFFYVHVNNHLCYNPHTPQLLYYIDNSMNVMQVSIGLMNRCESITRVCSIPQSPNGSSGNNLLTMQFPSAERAVISDGTGKYHVAAVKKDKWIIVFTDTITSEGSVLLSALQTENHLHILFRSVVEPKLNSVLHLLTVDENWQTVVSKKLRVYGNIRHCVIEAPNVVTLVIDSKKYPKFIENDAEVTEDKPKYKWTQTVDDVTILIDVKETGQWTVTSLEKALTVAVADEIIISGDFAGDVENVRWEETDGKLVIIAQKCDGGVGWIQAIDGDNNGEQFQADFEQNADATFNTEEHEEVDVGTPANLLRLDFEKKVVTHEVDLSTQQFIFTVHNDVSRPPAICVRHLTDACVWQFHTEDNNWKYSHVGTFSAFGYVQASKTKRKFIAAAENLSYVVISDAHNHLYLYRQPSPISGALRNRTSGVRVNAIARQHLISLNCNDDILGIRANNYLLFVLTKRILYIFVVNEVA